MGTEYLKKTERMEGFMKKALKFIVASLLLVMMSSQLCFAAEKQDIPENIPERIEIEGGVLELVNVPATVSTRVMPRYQYHVKTDGGNLNVRSGPGTSYSVIGQFANGQIVNIDMQSDHIEEKGWCYAGGDDCNTGKYIKGYIAIQYISD